MFKWDYKKYGTILGAGLVSGLILYAVLGWFIQAPLNRSLNKMANHFAYVQRVRSLRDGSNSLRFSFDHTTGLITQAALNQMDSLQVANRNKQALTEQVADGQVLDPNMPAYYYSPMVDEETPYSFSNRIRLVRKEKINDFAWYMVDGELRLYQSGHPFYGWHDTPFDGWYYYENGRMDPNGTIDTQTAFELSRERKEILRLTPRALHKKVYLESTSLYANMIEVESKHYSIYYKNPKQVILSAPPGTKNSVLVASTKEYAEKPMEVIEEIETPDGAWLHVNLGYDELGWIKKDDQLQDYHLTKYSERELLDNIQAIIDQELGAINARAGASFVNNESMTQVDIDNQIFFPASTQKIYVLAELYSQYKQGLLSPDTTVPLTEDDRVPGAGVIQGYPAGSEFTLDELVNLVALYSDNTAANMLITAVGGGEKISPHMHQLGMFDTYVNGKYYHGDTNREFYTTPHDAAHIFALLANERLNGAPWDGEMIDKLFLNSHSYIRTYIPGSTTSWNKSGTGGTEQNDVASFVTPYGSYTLAVYTANPAMRDVVAEQMAMLSLRVHDYFNQYRLLLWEPTDQTLTENQVEADYLNE